jgi:ribosomal protein L7Ae-like RNA K-turn-binding protein
VKDDAWRRLSGLLGLGVRSRGVVVGVDRVREAAFKRTLRFAVVAPDASRHSLDKVVPLLEARHIRFVAAPSAEALGGVVGKRTTAVVGVVDSHLARGIRAIVESGSPGAHREETV